MTQSPFSFQPIGFIRSCFKEKFGIPRQPGLAPAAKAVLELQEPYARAEAVAGLEQLSHIWLQFVFHQTLGQSWKPSVRPPRLGGNQRMGVFATRSPLRPNPIGLSVVRLDRIDLGKGVRLHLSGIDMVDGTPVLDIKPYLPYVDCVDAAVNEFASKPPELISVRFSPAVREVCENYQRERQIDLLLLIEQVLQQDPRPQYQRPDPQRHYGMRLYDLDVRWRYQPTDAHGKWLIEVDEIVFCG